MFLSEMAFTSTLVTSFSRPPMWDKRKTCTWGRQGWLRRCLSSVTLEQRSKAIYVYLYALSLYSICTSSVCVLGPMCRGLCLLRSCLCLGKKKGRRRKKKLLSLSLCSFTLSLSWPPLPYSSASSLGSSFLSTSLPFHFFLLSSSFNSSYSPRSFYLQP